MKKTNVRAIVSIGMFSSIAFVLMWLKFPLPAFPSFLFVDFSDIPALIAALIFGPIAGVLVEFIKNVIHYLASGSGTGIPIDHISNFFAGILFVLPIYYIYSKLKTKKGMTIGLIIGTITMAVMMSILNYLIFLPAYTFLLHAPDMRNLVVPFILPFNIIKGIFASAIFMLIFIRMKAWIDKLSTMKSV